MICSQTAPPSCWPIEWISSSTILLLVRWAYSKRQAGVPLDFWRPNTS